MKVANQDGIKQARQGRRRLPAFLGLFVFLALVLSGCADEEDQGPVVTTLDDTMPGWVQEVDPPPGSTSFVPNAVTVHHNLTGPDEDVRLVINDVDVTTYSAPTAGLLSYDGEVGPIELTPGEYIATVQRVTLPVEGAQFTVLDSFTWSFSLD